jgi:hypothetical protein
MGPLTWLRHESITMLAGLCQRPTNITGPGSAMDLFHCLSGSATGLFVLQCMAPPRNRYDLEWLRHRLICIAVQGSAMDLFQGLSGSTTG